MAKEAFLHGLQTSKIPVIEATSNIFTVTPQHGLTWSRAGLKQQKSRDLDWARRKRHMATWWLWRLNCKLARQAEGLVLISSFSSFSSTSLTPTQLVVKRWKVTKSQVESVIGCLIDYTSLSLHFMTRHRRLNRVLNSPFRFCGLILKHGRSAACTMCSLCSSLPWPCWCECLCGVPQFEAWRRHLTKCTVPRLVRAMSERLRNEGRLWLCYIWGRDLWPSRGLWVSPASLQRGWRHLIVRQTAKASPQLSGLHAHEHVPWVWEQGFGRKSSHCPWTLMREGMCREMWCLWWLWLCCFHAKESVELESRRMLVACTMHTKQVWEEPRNRGFHGTCEAPCYSSCSTSACSTSAASHRHGNGKGHRSSNTSSEKKGCLPCQRWERDWRWRADRKAKHDALLCDWRSCFGCCTDWH